jgi:hypothetical protein
VTQWRRLCPDNGPEGGSLGAAFVGVVAELKEAGGEARADWVRERSVSSYGVDMNKKKRQMKMRRKGRRSVRM